MDPLEITTNASNVLQKLFLVAMTPVLENVWNVPSMQQCLNICNLAMSMTAEWMMKRTDSSHLLTFTVPEHLLKKIAVLGCNFYILENVQVLWRSVNASVSSCYNINPQSLLKADYFTIFFEENTLHFVQQPQNHD